MMTDELGNLLVLSSFGRGETDFDPGPATFNLIGKARRSLYVASYSSTGGLNWAFDIGESDEETDGTLSANDFALDSNGNIIITGGYTRTIDLDSGLSPTFSMKQKNLVILLPAFHRMAH